jgi:hypothetical protein
MTKFMQLRQGEIFWNEIREYVKEKENADECIFCGASAHLTLEHLLPRSRNEPDVEKSLSGIAKAATAQKAQEDSTSTSPSKQV